MLTGVDEVADSPPVNSDASCPTEVSLSSIVAISTSPLENVFRTPRPLDRTRPVRKRLALICLRGVSLKRRAARRPASARGRTTAPEWRRVRGAFAREAFEGFVERREERAALAP